MGLITIYTTWILIPKHDPKSGYVSFNHLGKGDMLYSLPYEKHKDFNDHKITLFTLIPFQRGIKESNQIGIH